MTTRTPILYKIDTKGKRRIWYAELTDNSYTTFAGLEYGALTSKTYTIAPGKAKGKNTPAQQAEKDMLSRERKKYERELYSYDLDKPHPLAFVQPMLALDLTKVPKRAKWESAEFTTQPKLNGVRCIANIEGADVRLTSRKGKTYKVSHLEAQLQEIFKQHPELELNKVSLDGEIYIHGVELGDITHAIANPGCEDHARLELRLFDCTEFDKFEKRYELLESLSVGSYDKLSIVACTPVKNFKELKVLHDAHVANGFEGVMLRDVNAFYEHGKKTIALFKYKEFQDSEFIIVNVTQDSEGGAILTLTTTQGITFDSRPMGTDQYRLKLWEERNTLPGKWVTVRYSTLLASGAPEFNRTLYKQGGLIRDYE